MSVINQAVQIILAGFSLSTDKIPTLNNDLGFVEHTTWYDIFHLRIYLCDRYNSWQKAQLSKQICDYMKDFLEILQTKD